MQETFCPECGNRVKINAYPQKGQRITCLRCKAKLTVISINPVELDWEMEINHSPKKNKNKRIEVICPECDNFIKMSAHAQKGQQVTCNMCDASLQVVSTNPPELDTAFAQNSKRNRPKKIHRFSNEERKKRI